METKPRKIFEEYFEYPPENERDQHSNVRSLQNLLRNNKMKMLSVSLNMDYKNDNHEEIAGEILESVNKLINGKLVEFKGLL